MLSEDGMSHSNAAAAAAAAEEEACPPVREWCGTPPPPPTPPTNDWLESEVGVANPPPLGELVRDAGKVNYGFLGRESPFRAT